LAKATFNVKLSKAPHLPPMYKIVGSISYIGGVNERDVVQCSWKCKTSL